MLSIFVIGLTTTVPGCSSPEAEETVEPLETTEDRDITRLEVEVSIAGWIPGNADDVSDTIGVLVTADTPIARDIAAKAIKTALLTELEISAEHTRPLDVEDKYSVRVAPGFPLLFELPIVGEKITRSRLAMTLLLKMDKL